jgi:Fe-Mn family superoxide dismutase
VKFEFPKLPYALDALEPVLSREQVDEHYNKHHRKYYDNLVKLAKGTEFEDMDLVEIIRKARNDVLFNNAAQVYNHDVWWNSLSPEEVKVPQSLQQAIEDHYGTFDAFKEEFLSRGTKHFGSGWIWLVWSNNQVAWWTRGNAETPITRSDETRAVVLGVVDLWEHAWYIDYKSAKAEYLEKVFGRLNWNYVNDNLHNSM